MANHTRAETLNRIARDAAAARYKSLPPLPTQQELTRTLRELNANLEDGGCDVMLYCEGAGWPDQHWEASTQNDGPGERWPGSMHQESVPGEGKPFDAAAAARRLLSEARLAGFK